MTDLTIFLVYTSSAEKKRKLKRLNIVSYILYAIITITTIILGILTFQQRDTNINSYKAFTSS